MRWLSAYQIHGRDFLDFHNHRHHLEIGLYTAQCSSPADHIILSQGKVKYPSTSLQNRPQILQTAIGPISMCLSKWNAARIAVHVLVGRAPLPPNMYELSFDEWIRVWGYGTMPSFFSGCNEARDMYGRKKNGASYFVVLSRTMYPMILVSILMAN